MIFYVFQVTFLSNYSTLCFYIHTVRQWHPIGINLESKNEIVKQPKTKCIKVLPGN